MTYKEAKEEFSWRGRRVRNVCLEHRTYLVRREGYYVIQIFKQNDLMLFYPDGRIVVKFPGAPVTNLFDRRGRSEAPYSRSSTGYYVCWADRNKVNKFLPVPWEFIVYRNHCMIKPKGGEIETAREAPLRLIFTPEGKLSKRTEKKVLQGRTYSSLKEQYAREDKQREDPRRRGRYWVARARNLYRIRCNKKPAWRWCKWVNDPNRNNGPKEYGCGCKTYRKNIKFSRTVADILGEPNATVRSAMMKLYGIQKFFIDAGAKPVHTMRGYTLLKLRTGRTVDPVTGAGTSNRIYTALKMKCPSTGTVYINLVPDQINRIHDAVDWMFNVRDYLNKIGQET